jgi:DNA-binding HxlR family transcriptional regulator
MEIPKDITVGSCDVPACVSRQVLDVLASRWALLIVRQLLQARRRYSELRAAIGGVSEKMLAQTLRELERVGLISRISYPVVPPHVEYELTALGKNCASYVFTLLQFIENNVHAFNDAQTSYDERYAKR